MSNTEETTIREGQRIAKVMARAGLCSRRDAEAWIEAGRVKVNGKVLDSPAYNVSDADDVRVDNEPLKAAERTRLFLFHKPRGLVTTARDPEGRATIFDALPEDLPRVVAIGRLDINTEGLLLLTNDGGLARVLELPATGWLRRYRVRAHGEVSQEQLDALREGVTIEGMNYAGIDARLERQQGANVWLMMGLREGKNREIKRVLEHLGLEVNRLIRVSFGPFELGDLGDGEVVEVRTRVLRDQLGPKLAKQAGVDLETPAEETHAPPPQAHTLLKSGPAERPRRGQGIPSAERPARPARGGRVREGGERPRFAPKGREDRAAVAAELASRGQRPETVAPRKRKHVVALRAEAQAETSGPRRRIERSATADRKGREVKVERVMKAKPEPETASPNVSRPARERPQKERRDFSSGGDRRGKSEASFGAGRDSSRTKPSREAPREARGFSPGDERKPRRERPFENKRPARSDSEGQREPRSFSPRSDRRGKPDGFSKEAPRSRGPRAPEDRPREARSFSPRGERFSKSKESTEEGRRPARTRPPSDGPRNNRSRSEGDVRRPGPSAKAGDRPKRSFSGGPAREGRPSRPGGDKPRGGGGRRPPRKS